MTDELTLSTSDRIQAWIDKRPKERPLRCWVLGYGPLGQAVAEGLLTCNPKYVSLNGVFPWSSKSSEKHFAREPSEFLFRQWLKRQGINILGFPSVNHYQFTQQLLHDQIDLVIVATWGEILSPTLINQTQTLFINIHPSLLPFHRGPNPYAAAIMQQDRETGISAHVIEPRVDTGPIIAQYSLPIHDNDTGLSLRKRTAELTQIHMPDIIHELYSAQHAWSGQDEQGSYDKWLTAEDCHINWHEEPVQLDHRLRALFPWDQPWCVLPPWKLIFDSGRVIPHKDTLARKAGTVIQYQRRHLLVTTGHHNRAVMLVNPSLEGLWRVFNPVVLPFLLRPGRQL